MIENSQLESGSVCAGIGGFDLGFERAGIRTAWQIEFEDKANAILARHFPNADRRVRDLTDPTRSTLKKVSILCGGTPCQGFSIAGLRGSLEDDRSNLCLQFVKLVYEIDPAIIVWENVPGVLSSKDNAFGVFLAGLVGADSPLIPPRSITRWRQSDDGTEYFSWPNAGVVVGPKRTVAWRILDTQFFGAPQRRERVFLIGDTLGGCSPEILFEPKSMCGDYSTGGKTGEEIAGTLGASTSGGFGFELDGVGAFDESTNGKPITREDVTDVSPSVTAKWAKGVGGPAGDECQNLVSRALTAEGFDASEDGTGIGTPIVGALIQVTAFESKGVGDSMENLSPTLRSMNHSKSHANGGGQVAIAFQPGNLTRRAGAEPSTTCFPTLGADTQGDQFPCDARQTGVRRLMPNECERLQGFPDNWTDGQADGNRYRQLGNAVSVPVAEWIGRRIVKALQKKK